MNQTVQCWVCSEEETDQRLLSACDGCGQDFHLNPFQTPGKDCGEVTVDEDPPILLFFCQPCIDGTTAALLGERSAGS